MIRFREVATGLQFPEGPVALADGSVLLVEVARGTLSRVTPAGLVEVVAETGGGPNGAAIGPDGSVYLCNNGGFRWTRDAIHGLRPVGQAENYSGGRIERVDLNTGRVERVYDQADGLALRGPNDLVFDAHGGFYFTDFGKTRDHEMDRGGLFYALPDGSSINVIARPAFSANGTAMSPDGSSLYYAETSGARLWAFDVEAPGRVRKAPWPPSPQGARCVVASPGGHYQLFDSMAVDSLGNVLVATIVHSGITVVSPDGRLISHVPLPDLFVTNLCFGGRDMRTLFVTLSGSGRLIAIDDWPLPGLPLHWGQ